MSRHERSRSPVHRLRHCEPAGKSDVKLSNRLLNGLWLLFAITPVVSSMRATGSKQVVCWTVYLVGGLALWLAQRRDPQLMVLKTFASSRVCLATAVFLLIGIQAGAWLLPAEFIAFAVMFSVAAIFVAWAGSGSSRALERRVGGCLLLSTVLVGLTVLVESALAVQDSFRPRNDMQTVTWGHPVSKNRFGFRERDFSIPKPLGMRRIMVLGDSLTFGTGLSVESRFTELLERQLNTTDRGGRVEVLNFGVSGIDTARELTILDEHIDRVAPDLVVIGFCINDPQPRQQNYAVELERFRLLFSAITNLKLLRLNHLSGFLERRTDQLLRNLGAVPQHDEALDRVYVADSLEWQSFCQTLAGIVETCRSRRLPPPVFVPLPFDSGDFNHPNAHLRKILTWNDRAAEAATTAGMTVVRLEEEFRREGDRVRWVNSWDAHPDGRCHEVYASQLATALSENIATLPSKLTGVASSPPSNSKGKTP